MKKQIYIALGIVVLVILALWYFLGGEASSVETISTEVKRGEFKITVTTTGELEAKNAEEIKGPSNLRQIRVYNVKISDMVPDGTVVDSGDFVASLDRSELEGKIKDQELEMDNVETQLMKVKLDTSLELRGLRDALINQKFALEEIKIRLDQSKYEPPTTIRQVNIELEKAERNYKQSIDNYQLKLKKNVANVKEVKAKLAKSNRKYQDMVDVMSKFTIYAPRQGMVIYRRDWNGKKRGVGSEINPWDNVVATLPDLTEMLSKTYVNEIDISKVKVGQSVEMGIDAFPEKSFTGEVTEVANIGQQLPGSNVKVFEVVISVNEYDSVMRPAMTTKNIIITDIIDSVLFIPIECLYNIDSITYVVSGSKRKQVIIGKSNDTEMIIRAGLEEGDEVYLIPPEGYKDFKLVRLDDDILEVYREEERQKKLLKIKNDSIRAAKQMENKMNNGMPPGGRKMMMKGRGKK
jgi:multidrug efflux pump subunit AcrA (membrane-fusion protein)